MIAPSNDFVKYSLDIGNRILKTRPEKSVKEAGQFLTPYAVACFMAHQLGPIRDGGRLLEPSIGAGTLACAVIERLIHEGNPIEFWIDGFEIDPELCKATRSALTTASEIASKYGIIIHWKVYEADFILECAPSPQPSLFPNFGPAESPYDYIIANPPYFKLNSQDPRAKIAAGKVKGHTNIYTLFMAFATKLLVPNGQACFIVPRSFCSGLYFSDFRRNFLQETKPIAFHVFDTRDDIFKDDEVLQENVILTFKKRHHTLYNLDEQEIIHISSSTSASELSENLITRPINMHHFLSKKEGAFLFRLPTGTLDEKILEEMDQWEGSLDRFGLQVSTGPVVAFRAKNWLTETETVSNGTAVPLLWMQHIQAQKIEWPIAKLSKPQGIQRSSQSDALLTPKSNYVILRRFSAKEDRRRLIAAPFLAEEYSYDYIGLENHLNYIYRRLGQLTIAEAIGLSALLNSALIDRYFRITNGNTQVNAAELRNMPLPPLEIIQRIGEYIHNEKAYEAEAAEHIIFATLQESGLLSENIPILQETRIRMGKIEQAQLILKELGLPTAQQNEMAALTLLVLAQLSEDTPWENAQSKNVRVHDILIEIKQRYGREYAENTRETIRRQVLHQFEQAGLATRNPDDLSLATNSPRTHYSLSNAALLAIRSYNTSSWQQSVKRFIEEKGALIEIYNKAREQTKVPLQIADGSKYLLSPSKHNELEAQIIHEFGPRFAPGSQLYYLGDAANKVLILDKVGFEKMHIPTSSHGKLPDIVLYDEQREWVFLIEAVTSHGPVSPKRQIELEEIFKDCPASRVYVTAFPDIKTFKRFAGDIAWETEIWIAENPDHMIHFNGEKFIGPHTTAE